MTIEAIAARYFRSSPVQGGYQRITLLAVGVAVAGVTGTGRGLEAVICAALGSSVDIFPAAGSGAVTGQTEEYPGVSSRAVGLEAVPGCIGIMAMFAVETVVGATAQIRQSIIVDRRNS